MRRSQEEVDFVTHEDAHCLQDLGAEPDELVTTQRTKEELIEVLQEEAESSQ